MQVTSLPRWKCHKEVHAAKIRAIDKHGADGSGTLFLQLDDGADPDRRSTTSIDVTPEWMARFKPEAGGYYVLYADGYASFSPAKAFEEGYARLP